MKHESPENPSSQDLPGSSTAVHNDSHHSEMIEHDDIPQQNLNFKISNPAEEEYDNILQGKSSESKRDDLNDSFDRRLQELRDKISKSKTKLKKHTPSLIQFRNSLSKQDTDESNAKNTTTGNSSKLGELYSMVNPMQNASSGGVSDKKYLQSYRPFVSKNKALSSYNSGHSVQNVNNYLNINYNIRKKNNPKGKEETRKVERNDVFWNAYEQRNRKESAFNKEFYMGHLNQFGERLFGRSDNDGDKKGEEINKDNKKENKEERDGNVSTRFHRLNLFV